MADQNTSAQTTTDAPTGEGQTAEAGTQATGNTGAGEAAETAPRTLLGGEAEPAGDAASDATDGEGKEGGEKPKAEGPPEKYEFTLPEGMALDEAALGKFEPVLRDVGLTNEQANKLAGVFAEIRAADLQASQTAFVEQVNGWLGEVKADPDLGGAKFDSTVKAAGAAMAAFGTPALREVLNNTGLGNHPELVRLMSRVGAALQEDKTAGPAGAGGGERSLAERLYGKT